ncbi:MAG TPA: response regulator [Caldithrix abyssi]|uniref:Response regulator n=1 Tax=Caldithrix abyssi TaxID=187145 RepID=A0A7V4WV30_CALAY|nr:response regulator [Caldithrix abyssi]
MRIIIADNEIFFAENVARYLQYEFDADVEYVGSASEAEESVNKTHFNLIIGDLDLPDSNDGVWLLKIAAAHPDLNIMITSAREIPSKIKNNKHIRLRGYFEKPFDLLELKKKILQLIEAHTI